MADRRWPQVHEFIGVEQFHSLRALTKNQLYLIRDIMSIIVDDPAPQLAGRVRNERQRRAWSLSDLAEQSGVSKAMLSKIEREEVSPTAVILARIASALGLTLAALLTPEARKSERFQRAADHPRWRDPATGYVRRQIFQSADNPLELVEVSLPAGARVALPASSYSMLGHVVFALAGKLVIHEGGARYELKPGDRLEFGPPSDVVYANENDQPCRYIVAVLRR